MAKPTRVGDGTEREGGQPDRSPDANDGSELIDPEAFNKWFAILEDRFDKEKSDLTAEAYRRALSADMGTKLFVIAAQRIFKHNTYFPSPQEFVQEARKVRRAKKNKIEMERSRRQQERIRERRAMEAREEFPDALLTGKKVAHAITSGEYSLNDALPEDTEESFRKADRTSTEE